MPLSEEQLCASKILIIDDEPAYIEVLELALTQGNFTNFRGVTSPVKACEEFVRFQPDLVLLDLYMPEMDGFAVLEQMKQSMPVGEFVPVLVLTGYSSAETRHRAIEAGVSDFLNKPIDYAELMLRMKNLLRTRFYLRQAREARAKLESAQGSQTGSSQAEMPRTEAPQAEAPQAEEPQPSSGQ